MEKKIIFWVISLSVVAVALAVLLPGGRKVDSDPKLPWDIQVTANNEIQVFNLTLNKSLLPEARQIFQNQGKVNLFVGTDGQPAIEAYFERVFLSGLRADFILALKADQSLLNQLVERGSRISRTSDTMHKIVLGSDDLQIAEQLPIEVINYIPAANLDEELINSRFGEPTEKIVETETGVTHWIYPDRGMTIGLNPEGKELIQYMPLERIQGLVEQIRSSNAQYAEKMKSS
ncbi:MAG: hypothetical protein KUF74_08780 [Candidatus Thiodiazotropha sp. (ex Ctena orbiculata)]|nr:hypothetical protein [Candidatus Thiodiazotropha taylori]